MHFQQNDVSYCLFKIQGSFAVWVTINVHWDFDEFRLKVLSMFSNLNFSESVNFMAKVNRDFLEQNFLLGIFVLDENFVTTTVSAQNWKLMYSTLVLAIFCC